MKASADPELKKQVEALIFSSGRKMEPEEIAKLIGLNTGGAVVEVLKQLKSEYEERGSPLMVIDEGASWKLAVREPYLPLVRKINPYTEFPKSVMETLAVIAWKQPILQSTVIKIRTNKAYDHIMELMEMGFVVKEKYGRTHMLKLTQKFYDYFDLQDRNKVKDLFKRFKDEEKMEQKQMNEFDKKNGIIASPELKKDGVGILKSEKPENEEGIIDILNDIDMPEEKPLSDVTKRIEESKKIMGKKGEEEEIIAEIVEAEENGDMQKENKVLENLGKIKKDKKVIILKKDLIPKLESKPNIDPKLSKEVKPKAGLKPKINIKDKKDKNKGK